MNKTENNTKRKMLFQVQALDFAVIEAGLFLDAHPDDKKAMEYYQKMLEKRDAAMEEFQNTYGPLTLFANKDDTQWQWVKGPWPWELED